MTSDLQERLTRFFTWIKVKKQNKKILETFGNTF